VTVKIVICNVSET